MKSATRFFLLSFLILGLCYLSIIILYLYNVIGGKSFLSILLGAGITFLSFLIGIWFFKIGINKSNSIFFISILGGIVFRLILTLIAVLMCLLFLELNRLSFIFSIFIFYFLHLSIEIIYLNLRKN
jgi:hypothetical protein